MKLLNVNNLLYTNVRIYINPNFRVSLINTLHYYTFSKILIYLLQNTLGFCTHFNSHIIHQDPWSSQSKILKPILFNIPTSLKMTPNRSNSKTNLKSQKHQQGNSLKSHNKQLKFSQIKRSNKSLVRNFNSKFFERKFKRPNSQNLNTLYWKFYMLNLTLEVLIFIIQR